jgi:hypothetical protein
VVAKLMWESISSLVGRDMGRNFESIGVCWLSSKSFISINVITSAALRVIWKLRNDKVLYLS